MSDSIVSSSSSAGPLTPPCAAAAPSTPFASPFLAATASTSPESVAQKPAGGVAVSPAPTVPPGENPSPSDQYGEGACGGARGLGRAGELSASSSRGRLTALEAAAAAAAAAAPVASGARSDGCGTDISASRRSTAALTAWARFCCERGAQLRRAAEWRAAAKACLSEGNDCCCDEADVSGDDDDVSCSASALLNEAGKALDG